MLPETPDTDHPGAIVTAIRAELDRRGQTRYWLAGRIGATPQQVYIWMRTGRMTVETAEKMARVLGCRLALVSTGRRPG